MLKNHLTIAFRSLYKHKMYSIVSILGLAIGIAFFTLLFLLVKHETSYDTAFGNANRTFRVAQEMEKGGTVEKAATTPFLMGTTLREDLPEYLESATTICRMEKTGSSIEYNKKVFNEKNIFFVDKHFLQVFNYPLAFGDAKSALKESASAIISQRIAKKYFGNDNPVGQKIRYKGKHWLTVTGVFEEKNYNSHFNFEFIISMNSLLEFKMLSEKAMEHWAINFFWTYITVKDNKQLSSLEYNLGNLKAYYPQGYFEKLSIYLQPVSEIHLYSNLNYEIEENGDIKYIYIFSMIAMLILVIAAINFTNLSTARYAARTKEIGVRKAIGADKVELTSQFIVESLFISLIAIFFAFLFIEAALPQLSDLSNHKIPFESINKRLFVATVLGSGLFIGFLSSLYPAYYLSSFRPSEVLGGTVGGGVKSKLFRQLLIIIQFAITIFLLISTFVSYHQFYYLRKANLGFNTKHIVMLPVSSLEVKKMFPKLKESFLASPDILNVTTVGNALGTNNAIELYTITSDEKQMFLPLILAEKDFLETFDIKLIAGSNFPLDSLGENKGVIINQAAVDFMGWDSEQAAIGKEFNSYYEKEKVIGVVENFNFESLHKKIAPLVINLPSKEKAVWSRNFIVLKVAPSKAEQAIQTAKTVWHQYFPHRSFEYFFLNDRVGSQYFKEKKLGNISARFSIVAIFIACIGLFGLSSFMVAQKKKEIAIRKAIGSTDLAVMFYLTKEFLNLVGIAILVALPVSYLIIQDWLHSFPYKIGSSLHIYIYSAAVTLLVTLLTVSYHTYKAATEEPTKALQG